MTKNPYLNAVYAGLYIALIVLLINSFQKFAPVEDGILIPMTMLSLFVFSASVMGLLFLYKPLTMYLDGLKKEALSFFLKTLGTFAGVAIIFVILMLVVR